MKEILKHLVETTVLPEDHYLDQDAEILEIFVEELDEIFANLQPLLDAWLLDPAQDELLVTIRRHFHTLKGSGRMVGAKASSEIAWTVEESLNRVIAKQLPLTTMLQNYVLAILHLYQYKLYPDFSQQQAHTLDLRPALLLGQQIQQNLSLEPALEQLLLQLQQLNNTEQATGLEQDVDLNADNAALEHTAQSVTEEIEVTEDAQARNETLAIFIEESEEHLATIEQFIALSSHSAEQYNQLVRALHTLRGSSAMAQADAIFDASSKVEHLFKNLLQNDTIAEDDQALLQHYVCYVRASLAEFVSPATASSECLQLRQQQFEQAWSAYDHQQFDSPQAQHFNSGMSALLQLPIDQLLDAELEFEQRTLAEYPHYLQQLTEQTAQLLAATQSHHVNGLDQLSQGLHRSYQALLDHPAWLQQQKVFALFAAVHQNFIYIFDVLATGERGHLSAEMLQDLDALQLYLQQPIEIPAPSETALAMPFAARDVAQYIAADKALLHSPLAHQNFDAEVLNIFLEEAEELSVFIDQDLRQWVNDASNTQALNNLMRHLHTLKGGANMLQAEHLGALAHELESVYERLIQQQLQVSDHLLQSLTLLQDDLSDRLQIIREQQIDYPASSSIALLQHLLQGGTIAMLQPFAFAATMASEQDVKRSTEDLAQDSTANLSPDHTAHLLQLHDAVMQQENVPELNHVQGTEDSVEAIARTTYLEEAVELIAQAENVFAAWTEQRSNRSLLLQLQRIAHSLKGGAKMVQLQAVADIAYELETAFEGFAVYHLNSNVYDSLLSSAFAWLKQAIVQGDQQYFESLKQNLSHIQYVDVSAQLPEKLTKTDVLSASLLFEEVMGDGTEPPSMLGEWKDDQQSVQSDEMIRISADLIEKMIDLSGENAINRSRIEMDLSQLGNTLTDMELAIQRLADQLRRMEGELESQILAKHSDLNARYQDFDPLEMDQYSSLNQLSKSLAESASDLVDFKSTLVEKIKDTEGILLQQSRIQDEIQAGLMRARLVPFSRLLPRLQRLVRQVSATLNKPTELLVNNTEGELDRTILEKMVAPLEHMLRNALDHGIESSEERLRLNKPAQGKIVLDISRQGTDIVLLFQDDGQGIDADKIRQKALAQGLIQPDQIISDQDMIQYIFHPGFSTAEKVTQISGRGVGLDVVQSGIKALGGQVSVSSVVGQGSSFTIRVPTTVAVSDALMVKVGDQQFAVPLAQIDRIVRISPTALDEFFHSHEDYFEIDHQPHKLRYLAEFVAHQPNPKLSGVGHSLPVLLIKGHMGQSIALLVDQLIGSRSQIVMKSIGEQFASVGVISGATILGDGHVCLILDGQNIARQVQASNRRDVQIELRDAARRRDQRHLVMIVDDSVTVRKVTSRLLERHGYDVVTAKDGVDAMEQLENIKPDLMLLDIEMPRMDGFEVTGLVRHHEVHRDLPIIMITSRTGEKHRDRAFSLGVSNYMGKPFQEMALLDNIAQALQQQKAR